MKKFNRVSNQSFWLPVMVSGLAAISAFADDAPDPNSISLGAPQLSGNGCPAGSASAATSPDGKSLSILFDSFQLQAGRSSGRNVDRKSCAITIAFHVPQGYSVSVSEFDFRGFNSLPQGARSQFNVQLFSQNKWNADISRSFLGPVSDDFTFTTQVGASAVTWSPCGKDINLKTQANMILQAGRTGEDAMASVDSTDVQASVVYQLQWRQCGQAPGRGTPPPIVIGGNGNGNGVPVTPPPAPVDPNAPLPYWGNCKIVADQDQGGYSVFSLGQKLIGHAATYNEAVGIGANADAAGRCSADGDSLPTAGSLSCMMGTQYGLYTGFGNSKAEAVSNTRKACLTQVIDAQVCNKAPVDCFANRR